MIYKFKKAIFHYNPPTTVTQNVGFLILRVIVGLALCTVFEKFFPRDGSWGPQEWFIADVAEMGFPFPTLFAWISVLVEFFGGILLMLGLFTRPAALLNLLVTFVAAIIYHNGDIAGSGLTAFLFMILCICILLFGAGKYSLDFLLTRKRISKIPKTLLILPIVLGSFNLNAQVPEISDLTQLRGQWTGNLTYTDYKDDVSQTQLNCDLEVLWKNVKGVFNFTFIEPNGQIFKDKTKIKLKKDRSQLEFDGTFDIQNFTRSEESKRWEMTIRKIGKDNNRNADLKITISLTENNLIITKLVKYAGSDDYFVRNRYTFQRMD